MGNTSEELSSILKTLKDRSELIARKVTYKGSAVSKSAEYLDLAIESGIVEIPVSEIETVEHLSTIRDDLVSVTVRNPENVKQRVKRELNKPALENLLKGSTNSKDDIYVVYSESECDGKADDCEDVAMICNSEICVYG